MPLPQAWLESAMARDLSSLAFASVRTTNSMLLLRVVSWRNTLARVGLPIPIWAANDIGLCFVANRTLAPLRPSSAVELGKPAAAALDGPRREWLAMLEEIRASEVIDRALGWRLSDALVSVLLMRVLGPATEKLLGSGRREVLAPLPLDAETYRDLDAQLPLLLRKTDLGRDTRFFEHFARERLRITTAVEQLDLDTLRMLGLLGTEAGAMQTDTMVDLLGVLGSPEANDVVNFSLDLLPSVLETKRATGQQSFAVDGYAGLARHGTIDSLVLSELAYDDDLFARRFLENEVFYYAREKQRTQDSRLHYLLVDASASMRGRRSTFARGLALTLAKKLLLRGEDVALRFFDSQLHDTMYARASKRRDSGLDVPYVLSFRGERGRNYSKVFALLAQELERVKRREQKGLVVYLLTHAECHVPVDTMSRLADLADIYGVFLLPSTGELELEYLDLLKTVQVVDDHALANRKERAARALDIVEHAATNPSKDAR